MLLDRDLRTRMHGAAEAALTRALERAGNRVRGRRGTLAASIAREHPPVVACAHVGPALVAEAGFTEDDLLDGAWEPLIGQFRREVQDVAAQAEKAILRAAPMRARKERLAEIRRAREQALDDACQWLHDSMTRHARSVLYRKATPPVVAARGMSAVDLDGDPVNVKAFAEEQGVPLDLMRAALQIAGGDPIAMHATHTSAPGMNDVYENPGFGVSVGVAGPAGGPLSEEVMNEHGLAVEGFVWAYGPAQRRSGFDGHIALDGVEFQFFDDPVLAVQPEDAWLGVDFYYPGDHLGCACDYTSIIIEGAAAPAATDVLEHDTKSASFASSDILSRKEEQALVDRITEALDFKKSKNGYAYLDTDKMLATKAGEQLTSDLIRLGASIEARAEQASGFSDRLAQLDSLRSEVGVMTARYAEAEHQAVVKALIAMDRADLAESLDRHRDYLWWAEEQKLGRKVLNRIAKAMEEPSLAALHDEVMDAEFKLQRMTTSLYEYGDRLAEARAAVLRELNPTFGTGSLAEVAARSDPSLADMIEKVQTRIPASWADYISNEKKLTVIIDGSGDELGTKAAGMFRLSDHAIYVRPGADANTATVLLHEMTHPAGTGGVIGNLEASFFLQRDPGAKLWLEGQWNPLWWNSYAQKQVYNDPSGGVFEILTTGVEGSLGWGTRGGSIDLDPAHRAWTLGLLASIR